MKKLTLLLVLLVAGGVCIAGCTTEENGEVLPTQTPEATETVPEEVTTPPTEEVTEEPTEEVTEPTANLVETAAGAGQFNTLVAAIEAAGLSEELSTGGPYTVFAPTDAAFAAIPAETLDALLASPDEELTEILTYHVVEGEYYAVDLANSVSLDTLQGTMLTISIDGDTVMVDGAQVIDQDIQASNGVIHVIDEVLVPIGVELPAATDGEMEEATEEMTEEVTEEMTEEETETPE